jgi:PAS domain S-box-containing protein
MDEREDGIGNSGGKAALKLEGANADAAGADPADGPSDEAGDGRGGERGSRLPIDDAALGRLILDSALDYALVTLSAEGLVTSWSEGAERIVGWSEDEIIGRSAELFFTREDNAAGRAASEMREAARSGRARDERYHMRRDGSRFYADGMMVPLRHGKAGAEVAADGPVERPTGFLKIFRDRTRAHETELRARELETGVAMALRASGSIGLYRFDPVRRLVWGDESCARMFDLGEGGLGEGMPADRFFERIHADDIERVATAQERAVREGAHLDVTFRVARRDGTLRWVHTLSDLHPQDGNEEDDGEDDGGGGDDGGGRASGVRSGMMIDVTQQHREARMRTALLEVGDRLRDLDDPLAMGALASEVMVRTLDLSRAGHGELGEDGDAIRVLGDATARGAGSLVGTLLLSDFGSFAEPLRRGETVVIEDAREDDRVPDAAALEGVGARASVNVPLLVSGRLRAALFVNDDRPRAWTDGEIAFVRGVFDRTYAAIDRVRAVRERELMNAELAHRMKNVLTIAQVVATQSLRHARTLEEGQQRVSERLGALGRAQDMLTSEDRSEVDIRSVIEDAMRPHVREGDARMSMEGPYVVLSAPQVLGLSLAVHELGTNAGKHGALAGDRGRVSVRWLMDDRRGFHLSWRERGTPPADGSGPDEAKTTEMAPGEVAARDGGTRNERDPARPRTGFGTSILNRVVGAYFNGRSALDLGPHGATFTIEGRLDELAAPDGAEPGS